MDKTYKVIDADNIDVTGTVKYIMNRQRYLFLKTSIEAKIQLAEDEASADLRKQLNEINEDLARFN